MIQCTKCNCSFDNSVDSICPQCGNEWSALQTPQNIELTDFEMPKGIKLSEAYEHEISKEGLKSLSLDVHTGETSSYLYKTPVTIIIISIIMISIPIFNHLYSSIFNFIFIVTLSAIPIISIYTYWATNASKRVLINIDENGLQLSMPNIKKDAFFKKEDISHFSCTDYETHYSNNSNAKISDLSLTNKQGETYNILIRVPSQYLVHYLKAKCEQILQIQEIQPPAKKALRRKRHNRSNVQIIGGLPVVIPDSPVTSELPEGTNNAAVLTYFDYQETPNKIILKKNLDCGKIKSELIYAAIIDIMLTLFSNMVYIALLAGRYYNSIAVTSTVFCICTLTVFLIYSIYFLTCHKTYEIELNHCEIIKYTDVRPNRKKIAFKTSIYDIKKIGSFERDSLTATTALRLFLKDGSYRDLIEKIPNPLEAEDFACKMNKFIKNGTKI